MKTYTHLIVGGGMYGCYVALRLKAMNPSADIIIVEREEDLFRHASYHNQARVHNGYHYPRSILTGMRSRVNAPRFLKEFAGAIVNEFGQYYAIGRRRSNVTPGQFEQFSRHIGADLRPAPANIRALFDDDLIEAVYAITEPVFDADKLRVIMRERIKAAGIPLMLETEIVRLERGGEKAHDMTVEICDRRTAERRRLGCHHLYNCTYSRINDLLGRSGLTTIRLRHEAAEIALIDLPPAIRNFSVTIMCGPFFSLMPFPARGLSTLSHVSYTPHYNWTDEASANGYSGHKPRFPLQTRFNRMKRDASRYLPALADARYIDSLWAVKTILPQSDANDSRPILYKRDPDLPNVVSILGGKIDNIFDLDDLFVQQAGQPEDVSAA